MKRTRHVLATAVAILFTASLLTACGSDDEPRSSADGRDIVRVGMFPGITTNAQVWLGGADYYDTFAEHGIELEIVPGNPQISASQLAAGDVDLVASNGLSVFSLNEQGEKVKMLNKLSSNLQILLARTDAGVAKGDFAGLEGKTVGVLGLNNQATVEAMLVDHDVDPKDVTFTQVQDDPTGRSLLESGEFDFYTTIEPGASTAVDAGFAEVWMDFRTEDAGYLQHHSNVVLFGNSTWLDENSDLAERFQAAVVDVIDQAKDDAEGAVELAIKGLPDAQPDTIERILPEEIATWAGPVTEEDVEIMNKVYVEVAGLAKRDYSYTDLVWQP